MSEPPGEVTLPVYPCAMPDAPLRPAGCGGTTPVRYAGRCGGCMGDGTRVKVPNVAELHENEQA